MALIEIEVNDVISTKEGKTYRVLSVYKNGNALYKVEGIDDNELTPMRRPIFSHEIGRVIRKGLKSAGRIKEEKELAEQQARVAAEQKDKEKGDA